MSIESETSLSNPVSDEGIKKLPWIAISVAVVLVSIYLWKFKSLPFGENPSAFGEFGDYIGGLLNPLISLFTLVVAVSVWKLQKTELIETRKALEEQGNTAKQQRREQRFFDTLRLYQETLRSVEFERSLESGTLSYSGKAAFLFITSNRYRNSATRQVNELPALISGDGDLSESDETKIKVALEEWAPMLDHYFRVIFLLLREAEPTLGDQHFRYIKYLRAQLSKDELQLLALNMLFDLEGKQMIPWSGNYGLLKHLPSGKLRDLAESRFPAEVFGRKWKALTEHR